MSRPSRPETHVGHISRVECVHPHTCGMSVICSLSSYCTSWPTCDRAVLRVTYTSNDLLRRAFNNFVAEKLHSVGRMTFRHLLTWKNAAMRCNEVFMYNRVAAKYQGSTCNSICKLVKIMRFQTRHWKISKTAPIEIHHKKSLKLKPPLFLQRVGIACYADGCISHGRVCVSVCLPVLPSHAGIVSRRMKLRSCGFHCQVAQSL